MLILDCENHKQLSNLISLHKELSYPGDAISRWSINRLKAQYVFLSLKFMKPMEYEVTIKFDLQKQCILADGIIQSQGVYIQSSESGVYMRESLDEPKILIEVPTEGVLPNWDNIIIKQIIKRIKKDKLTKEKNIKLAAHEILQRTREVWSAIPGDV